MKTILFINACLRGEHSRSLRIAEAYLEKLKKNEDFHLIERNLAEEKFLFYNGKSFDENGDLKHTEIELAKEFANSDEIIIASPFWEFMFPSILSSYLEKASVAGITFDYNEKGSVGLCKGKLLTYIYTAGDFLKEEDKISEQYFARLSRFYGIENFNSIYADGLDVLPEKADERINKVLGEIYENV